MGRDHRHGRPARQGQRLRTVGRVLAATLSVTLLVGFGYGWYQYRSLDSGLRRIHLSNLGKPAGSTGPDQPRHDGKDQNFLIVGIDSRDGLSAEERRVLSVGSADSLSTDTIMVIHVPADGRRATLISIPRDSYVDIPQGWKKNKINAAYANAYTDAMQKGASHQEAQAAGANLLVLTVSQLTGLTIDHYVQVGFGGFYTIAKALGSIPVNLCAATDDTHSHNEAQGLGSVGSDFKMSAGHHDLTPVQALQFVRQRHNLDAHGGDLAREKRQRYFLSTAFDKIASLGVLLDPAKLSGLIKAVTGAFYVDDNDFSLVDLAKQMSDLSANKITGYTIPTGGSAPTDVGDVLLVDPGKVQRFVRDRLNPPKRTSPPTGSTTRPRASVTPPPAATGCIY